MRGLKYILLSCLLLISSFGFAQKWKLSRSSYTYSIGVSSYFGDIGGASNADASAFADLELGNSRPVLAVGYYYKLYERIALKGNLSYANIHGSDANSLNEKRNLTFTSNMFELNGHIEYHILKEMQMVSYNKMSMRGKVNKFNVGVNLYVFAGIGGAYFNPKAKDNLEGNSRFVNNKNIAIVFPVGLGIKYPLTSTTSIGLELGGRFTTSDYIDGFTSESSTSKDIYYFTVINVSTKIKKAKQRAKIRF